VRRRDGQSLPPCPPQTETYFRYLLKNSSVRSHASLADASS
jgi:hypothetical protein